jgi:hypothetical protein
MPNKRKEIVYGGLGAGQPAGSQKGSDLQVRKPQYVEIESDYGSKLSTADIDALREKAIKAGTPENRLADGFQHDTFVATISDETKDRYGDRIEVAGWDVAEYRKNPVLLLGHDYESPAVGHALDISTDKVGAGTEEERPRLRGVFLWSRANPVAEILKGLYADGDMRAFSVGFIPTDYYVPETDDERKELNLGPFGVLHKAQVLLENSCVPVPANPSAIIEESARRAFGMKTIPLAERAGIAKLAARLRALGGDWEDYGRGLEDVAPVTTRVFDLGSRAAAIPEEKREAVSVALGTAAARAAGEHGAENAAEDVATVLDFAESLRGVTVRGLAEDIAEQKADPSDAVDSVLRIVAPDVIGEKRATMTPEGDVEDTTPEGDDGQLTTAATASADEGTDRVIPDDVSRELDNPEAEWVAPAEGDFPPFADLDDEGRTAIAGFYAHADAVPPTAFEQLRLAHHSIAEGSVGLVNLQGVQLALDNLLERNEDGAAVPDEERQEAYDHLVAHLADFGVEAPPFKGYADGSAEGGKVEDDKKKPKAAEIDEDPILDKGLGASERAGERRWRVVRSHRPEVAADGEALSRKEWDEAVGEDFEMRRKTSLIYDAADQKNPRAYLMPHHIPKDGTPVSLKMVQRSMRSLFTKAATDEIPEGVRRRGYFHLRTHFEQYDVEAPSYRALEKIAQLSRFLQDIVEDLTAEDIEARDAAELVVDMVYGEYQNASDKAYEIQSMRFDSALWESDDAKAFVRGMGFTALDVEESDNEIVFNFREVSHFVELSQRELKDDDAEGVSLLGGRLKSATGLLFEEVRALRKVVDSGFAEHRSVEHRAGSPRVTSEFLRSVTEDRSDEDLFETILNEKGQSLADAADKLAATVSKKD